MMIVAIHEPGYDINRKNSDLWLGNRPYIQIILTPTVPIIESIIGTVEYPIPLSAPGRRGCQKEEIIVAQSENRRSIIGFCNWDKPMMTMDEL